MRLLLDRLLYALVGFVLLLELRGTILHLFRFCILEVLVITLLFLSWKWNTNLWH